MGKASRELSKDLNRLEVGKFGGRGPRDINNPSTNTREKLPDTDHDGLDDYGVSRELSEDQNARWLGKCGGPAK